MAPKQDAHAAMKRKAEDAEEQPSKEAKKDSEEEVTEDTRPSIQEKVGFDPRDTTVNVIPTMGGRALMSLSEGGMQYLLAGARANVGVTTGCYMFEVRLIEAFAVASQQQQNKNVAQMTKHTVRLGFSTSSSSLFLGSDPIEDSVCFDLEGYYCSPGPKKREPLGHKFSKDHIIGCAVNVDSENPSSSTISLFKDGNRVGQPIKLPQCLHGKTLFPHVAFRNASVQVNFGPEPLSKLPPKCRLLQTAAAEDVAICPSSTPKDGKFDVVFPIGVPDEGTFPWVDEYLKENPHLVELSDRTIVEWATKSGLFKPKSRVSLHSNDAPDFNFGVPALDDLSPCKVLKIAAPLVPRHYLVMEVKGNLMPSIRKDILKRFKNKHYKRIAKVVVGEPPKDWKDKVLNHKLQQKQSKLDALYKQKQVEKEKEKKKKAAQEAAAKKKAEREAAIKKQKEDLARKKAEALAKKKAEQEAKEAAEKAAEKGEAEEKTEEEKHAEEEKKKAEEEEKKKKEEEQAAEQAAKEEEARKEEEAKAEAERKAAQMEEEDQPPVAELTEEEKKEYFPKREYADLTASELASSFTKFALPDSDEGFDNVDFVWSGSDAATEHLRSWVAARKISIRCENLQPSAWFAEKYSLWQATLQEWQVKQQQFTSEQQKKATEAAETEQAAADNQEEKEEGQEEANDDEKDEAKDKVGEEPNGEKPDGGDVEMKDADESKEAAEDGTEKQAAEVDPEDPLLSLTNARLKQMCKEKGLDEFGSKAELIKRIKAVEAAAQAVEAAATKDAEVKEKPTEEKKDDEKAEKVVKEDVKVEPEVKRLPPPAVWDVKDICDVRADGTNEPLFLDFAFEDWSLVTLRFELDLLAKSFLHDMADPERIGIHDLHIVFYYLKYYKKALNPKFYGADSVPALLNMVADTVRLDEQHSVMMSQIKQGEDGTTPLDTFVRLVEEARRDRQRRIDSGDLSAKLKFNVLHATAPASGKAKAAKPVGALEEPLQMPMVPGALAGNTPRPVGAQQKNFNNKAQKNNWGANWGKGKGKGTNFWW